jgi:predicted SAM-dependent methyltransferase
MNKEIRLHLGCGPVYLDGWINIDVYADGYSWLAIERPDIMDYNKTTLDNYYKHSFGKREHNLCVVDEFMDITDVPYDRYGKNEIDKILIVNAFEHFSKNIAYKMLEEWYEILKIDGELIIDGIPDLKGTLELLNGKDDEWPIRLIYGTQKNQFSFHKWGYTYNTIKQLCKQVGFRETYQFYGIPHDYPTFGIRAVK